MGKQNSKLALLRGVRKDNARKGASIKPKDTFNVRTDYKLWKPPQRRTK